MKPLILKKSVIGASHKIKENGICQDRNLVEFLGEDIIVAAVADGHGSEKCRFSDRGAEFAVNVFFEIIEEMYFSVKDIEQFIQQLRQNDAAKFMQVLHSRWTKKIKNSYSQLRKDFDDLKDEKNVDPELYGTTLLGIVISPEFVFAIQLGDGDIVYVDNEGVKYVIDPPKFLGTETFSLSNKTPWNHAVMYFQRINYIEKAPCMFILTSDGFSNSFLDNEQYYIACKDYFEITKTYGQEAVQKQLQEWLEQTSAEGCGDDITFVGVGVFKNSEKSLEAMREEIAKDNEETVIEKVTKEKKISEIAERLENNETNSQSEESDLNT